jgi:hypothetical protein
MRTNFLTENLKGRNYSEDLDVDGRIICNLTQNREQCWALVNSIMNL